jgi:putative ABC transport system substrate-binding protein
MRRREFIGLIGGAAATWSLAARAQSNLPHVGFLLPGTPAAEGAYVPAFLRGLNENSLVTDRDFVLDLRYAEGRLERIPALVNELVDKKVDVLVVGSTTASIAAKQKTTGIPIVFLSGDDPINVGLVSSLNQPGGNVTGISLFATELIPKRISLLLDLAPSATMMGLLVNPANPNAEPDTKRALMAMSERGRQGIVVKANSDADIDAAFVTLIQQRAATLLSHADAFLNSGCDKIVGLATRNQVVGNYPLREYVTAGGLMSYGVNFADSYRQAGVYTGRILKGAKPADLPVLQPTKFEFVISLRTAKMLGLTFPPGLLAVADEVIE